MYFFSCSQVTEGFFLFPQMKLQESEKELEPDNKLAVKTCYKISDLPLLGDLIQNQFYNTHQW